MSEKDFGKAIEKAKATKQYLSENRLKTQPKNIRQNVSICTCHVKAFNSAKPENLQTSPAEINKS
jgi:hypothetical protein